MKSEDPHFRLRVPGELKARVETAAKANNRSMNAEIVARLEEHQRIDELERELLKERHQRKLLSDHITRLEDGNAEIIKLRERTESLVSERRRQDDYIEALRKEVERYKLEAVRQEAMAVAGREMGAQMEKVFAELSQSLREEIADLRAWLRVLEIANASLKSSNKTLSDLLEWHDKMIEDAAKGDDSQLRAAVESRADPEVEKEIQREMQAAGERVSAEPFLGDTLTKEEWETLFSIPKKAKQSVMAALLANDKEAALRIAKRAAMDAQKEEAEGTES